MLELMDFGTVELHVNEFLKHILYIVFIQNGLAGSAI